MTFGPVNTIYGYWRIRKLFLYSQLFCLSIFCIFLKFFFLIKKKKSFTFFSDYKGVHAMSSQGLASLIDSGEQRDPDEVMSRNNILVAAERLA